MWWDQWSSSKDGTCYHRSRVDWCPCPTGRVLPGSHWDIPPMTGRVTGWWTGGARGQGHISPQAAGDRHRSSSMVKNCHAGLLIRVESCGILSSIRRWFNGVPASKTLAHRWISVGNVLNRSTLLQIPKSVAVLARRLAPTGPVFCLSPAPFSGSVPFPSSPVTRAVPATHSRAGLAGIPPASRQLLREGHIDRDHGWADTAWWELCHRAPCRTPPETRRPQRFRRAILSAKPPTGFAKVREYSPVRPLGKINTTRGVPSKITTFYRTVWENADFQPCFAEARQRWRWMSTHQTSLTLAANAKPLGGGGGEGFALHLLDPVGVQLYFTGISWGSTRLSLMITIDCFAEDLSGFVLGDWTRKRRGTSSKRNTMRHDCLVFLLLTTTKRNTMHAAWLSGVSLVYVFQEKHHTAWLPGLSLVYAYIFQEKHHAARLPGVFLVYIFQEKHHAAWLPGVSLAYIFLVFLLFTSSKKNTMQHGCLVFLLEDVNNRPYWGEWSDGCLPTTSMSGTQPARVTRHKTPLLSLRSTNALLSVSPLPVDLTRKWYQHGFLCG